jgi:hypothetical protein
VKKFLLFTAGGAAILGLGGAPALATTGPTLPSLSTPAPAAHVPVSTPALAPVLSQSAPAPAATSPASPVSGGAGSYSASSSGSSYTPPLHGTNPHGEGTAASVSTQPTSTPDSSDCSAPSSDQALVVGRSCGQQNSGGSYSGHVTIVAVGGHELLGENSTSSGTTATGTLAPASPALAQLDAALKQICSGTQGNLCLVLASANSSTNANGSSNSFEAVGADVGGKSGVQAHALTSSGNISQTSSCQQASGSSSVADLSAGGTNVASVAKSSDSSTACQNSSQNSQTFMSSVFGGAISQLTSPVIGQACANGTPNTQVKVGPVALPGQLASVYCNATDSNGSQAAAPYGTNEGLTAIALGGVGLHVPSSESLARAPAASPAPGPPPGQQPPPSPSSPSPSPSPSLSGLVFTSGPASPALASAPSAQPAVAATPSGRLAFTGLDVMLLILAAVGLMGAGFALWLVSRRRPIAS